MKQRRGWGGKWFAGAGAGSVGLLAPLSGWAQSADPKPWQLNMGKGVTQTSRLAWESNMLSLIVVTVIGVIVFGALFYACFKFRRSKGAVAATFSHNTRAEIIWTVIPVIILVVMAWPATANLIKMYDTRDAEMTVKVTGYQWMWRYEYLGEGVEFTSRLDRESDRVRQSGQVPDRESHPHYLLDVDNRLVLPVDTKVRFVITSDDVIHAWWVPALGWKQDAIPGFINEAWTSIETPGVYRGQCAELCGKDHGFMPIVVEAVSKEDFRRWLAQKKPAPAGGPQAPAPGGPEAAPEPGPGTEPRQPAPPVTSPAAAEPTQDGNA